MPIAAIGQPMANTSGCIVTAQAKRISAQRIAIIFMEKPPFSLRAIFTRNGIFQQKNNCACAYFPSLNIIPQCYNTIRDWKCQLYTVFCKKCNVSYTITQMPQQRLSDFLIVTDVPEGFFDLPDAECPFRFIRAFHSQSAFQIIF